MEKMEHIFNSLKKLAILDTADDSSELALPEGFWQERYKRTSVSIRQLEKEKNFYVMDKWVPLQKRRSSKSSY